MISADSIILHIPHSSYLICPEYRDLFFLNNSELFKEQLKMTDSFTDDLFDLPLKRIVFPISRLLCDVERFRDENVEPMCKKGMGICYTRTSELSPLKRTTDNYTNSMMLMYDAHHRQLVTKIEECLRQSGECLIMDCHSFASERLPYEEYSDDERPEICIGLNQSFNENHYRYFKNAFEKRGYKVALNNPFSGALIPEQYYQKDGRVSAVMIEINRSLYINERTGEKNSNYNIIKDDIREIINGITKEE